MITSWSYQLKSDQWSQLETWEQVLIIFEPQSNLKFNQTKAYNKNCYSKEFDIGLNKANDRFSHTRKGSISWFQERYVKILLHFAMARRDKNEWYNWPLLNITTVNSGSISVFQWLQALSQLKMNQLV